MAGLGPVFRSGELAFQLLSISLLLGHAVGYRCPGWTLPLLATVTCLSSTVLFGLRSLSGSYPGLALSLVWSILATAGMAHLTVEWWRRREKTPRTLALLYSSEMLGACLGFAGALLLGSRGLISALPWLVALTIFSNRRPLTALLCLLLAAIQAPFLSQWEDWGRRQVLDSDLGQKTTILASAFSPYQVVEVVETRQGRYLFLNGMCHHDPIQLVKLNDLLAALPAEVLTPQVRSQGALILGAGALMSAAETQKRGWSTTVVELDPKVMELSKDYFAPINGLDLHDANLQLVVDDARSFCHREPRKYGLIVFSLPYPYSLNAASLFTREFFQKMADRLQPDGAMAVFLGSPVQKHRLDPIAGGFLRALRQTFPNIIGVSSFECQNTVVYVSHQPSLTQARMRSTLLALGHSRFRIYSAQQLDNMIGYYGASNLWDFRFCARLNLGLWGGR